MNGGIGHENVLPFSRTAKAVVSCLTALSRFITAVHVGRGSATPARRRSVLYPREAGDLNLCACVTAAMISPAVCQVSNLSELHSFKGELYMNTVCSACSYKWVWVYSNMINFTDMFLELYRWYSAQPRSIKMEGKNMHADD